MINGFFSRAFPAARSLVANVGTVLGLVLGSMTTAQAGSTATPGLTTGTAVYATIPEGVYLTTVDNGGVRSTRPNTFSNNNVFFFYDQTPFTFLGARVALIGAPTLYTQDQGIGHITGLFNPYLASQLTWDLGGGLGVGYRLGGFVPINTPVSYNYGTIDQRFGATYLHSGYDFTANFEFGIPQDDLGTGRLTAPNYLNLDLTAAKKFGNLELGAVAYTTNDITTPFGGYRQQHEMAVGGLIGYQFTSVSVQLKLTHDVFQRNYGGYDTRAWLNMLFPLYSPTAAAADYGVSRRQ